MLISFGVMGSWVSFDCEYETVTVLVLDTLPRVMLGLLEACVCPVMAYCWN